MKPSVRLLQLAADQGNAHGQIMLGGLYAEGRRGIAQDDAKAVRLFRLAAEQGNAIGQTDLAEMYYAGRSVDKDMDEAAKLFALAAAQNFDFAQYRLGMMTINGEGGIAADSEIGITLIKSAARQGNAPAREYLRSVHQHW